jgi:hypothetical protein
MLDHANRMAAETLPNFFIAGAPKAGTTSLYHNLRQHPEIYMSPVKEPAHFASEVRVEGFAPEMQPKMRAQMKQVQICIRQGLAANNDTRGIVAERSDYLRLFEGVRDEKAAGEASVCYLWSKTAPGAIAECIPHAKIILILRHPAERAYSQYLHFLSDGHFAHSFGQHIQACLKGGDSLNLFHPFLQYGLYAEQVERYLALFPRDQVRIWIYEETLKQPAQFLREVFEFLGVDPQFVPDTATRYHEMQIPRSPGIVNSIRRTDAWKAARKHCPAPLKAALKRIAYQPKGAMQMSAEERRFLVDHYRADVCRLQTIIGRDLSAWMV